MGFSKCSWQDFDLNPRFRLEVGMDTSWEFPSMGASQNSSSKSEQGEKQGYPGASRDETPRKQNKTLFPKGTAVPALLSGEKGAGMAGIDPEQLLGCGRADGSIIFGMRWAVWGLGGFGIFFPGNLSCRGGFGIPLSLKKGLWEILGSLSL